MPSSTFGRVAPGQRGTPSSRLPIGWVREGKYPNRSRALQFAVDLLTEKEKRTRLTRELAKLDPTEEKQLAEEGLGDRSWPRY